MALMSYGKLLRARRMQRGMSLNRLAELMGISGCYLSHVERGLRPPFPEHYALRVSRILSDRQMLVDAEQARGEYWRSVREGQGPPGP